MLFPHSLVTNIFLLFFFPSFIFWSFFLHFSPFFPLPLKLPGQTGIGRQRGWPRELMLTINMAKRRHPARVAHCRHERLTRRICLKDGQAPASKASSGGVRRIVGEEPLQHLRSDTSKEVKRGVHFEVAKALLKVLLAGFENPRCVASQHQQNMW